ncbi:hypothetical protein J6590_080411 [Homalodisca vitripennis]|nr:hypothetical protein J6590_080411 [Homalodisca vitripennis]
MIDNWLSFKKSRKAMRLHSLAKVYSWSHQLLTDNGSTHSSGAPRNQEGGVSETQGSGEHENPRYQ